MTASSSKTIAKNTMFLYFRMFLTLGFSLYTSRLVLEALGVINYGLYGLVGGIVTMFAFINSSMSAATQRYLSFDIGKGNEEQLKKTFNASLNIHFLIGVVIVLLAETIGLWFVNFKLDIPSERLTAANWVYQFSILAFFLQVIKVPYDALIIARERMNIYAYMSFVEVILKLIIVFVLLAYGNDRLILYAILTFCVSLIVFILFAFYCKKYFKESIYQFYYDKKYYIELLSFSGWNLFGNMVIVLRQQGTNILLNLFLGPIVNAAYLLTMIIQGIFESFASNFQIAVNPQIVQSYSNDNIKRMENLIQLSMKFTFFGLAIIIIPLYFNVDYLLSIWLKEIPGYTSSFVKMSLIYCMISLLSAPLITGIQATGKIKVHQIISSLILLFNILGVWIILRLNYPPYFVFLVFASNSLIVLLFRVFMFKKLIKISIKGFLNNVAFRITTSFLIFLIVPLSFNYFSIQTSDFYNFIFKSMMLEIYAITIILIVGISKQERDFIFEFVRLKKKHFKL